MQKIRRIMAWLTIVVIALLLIAMLICAVSGSRYFFVFLFLAIFVPVVLWVFMWFTRLMAGESEVISKKDLEELERAAMENMEQEPENDSENDSTIKDDAVIKGERSR